MKKKILQLVGGNWLNTMLSGVLGIYVARVLGPEQKGVYALAVGSISILASVISLGSAHSAAYHIRKRPDSARAITRYLNYLMGIGSLAITALMFSGEQLFSDLFLDGKPVDTTMIALLAGCTISTMMNGTMGSAVISKQEAGAYAKITNIATIGTIIVTTVGFLVLDQTVQIALLGLLAGQSISFVLFRRRFSSYVIEECQSELSLCEFVHFGLKVYPGAIASLAFKRIDLFIVGYFLPSSSVGYYSIGLNLRELGMTVPRAVGGLLSGEIADRSKDMRAVFRGVFRSSVWSTALFGLVSFVVALLLFPILVPLVYGEAFRDAAAPSIILTGSLLPLSLAVIFNAAVSYTGNPVLSSAANILGAAVGVLVTWVLTRDMGIEGASYAALANSLILSLISGAVLHWCYSRLGMQPSK